MLVFDDIKVEFESQGFKGTHLGTSPQKDKTVMFLESIRETDAVRCPVCGESVYIYENYRVNLKDIFDCLLWSSQCWSRHADVVFLAVPQILAGAVDLIR